MSVLTPASSPASVGFLDRSRTIAGPGYNRWLIPPAALAIHLAIGQAYAFSVFKKPLMKIVGVSESLKGIDWEETDLFWIFSLAIIFLGLSAAVFGTWLERAGPRKAMFTAAVCFGSGFLVSALGVYWHQIFLIYLGYGVIGGIGLGLGYISPVSTLIKWFPDRPGMATGLAIMGFGGGAMIGSPLAEALMKTFASPTSTGVGQALVAMGIIYFVFMMFGVLMVRLPPPGWKPAGYVPGANGIRQSTVRDVTASEAVWTPQFWLLWVVLFTNVTAGIGILEHASPMIQEMFPGSETDSRVAHVTEPMAVGFVGLLSLFNMLGRFGWSSLSDYIGRKNTYTIYFILGAILYFLTPRIGQVGMVGVFVLCCGVILSMYGGGFATIPAYLRDLFGTGQVGAIHGRLLTAWSAAGIAGPAIVNYLLKYETSRRNLKAPDTQAFTLILSIMAGLLLVGLVCNLLVRPLPTPSEPLPTEKGA
jgi:MFS family permease